MKEKPPQTTEDISKPENCRTEKRTNAGMPKMIFQQYAEESTYLGEAQFELRFHHLDYDLIGQLQQDDSVNQQLKLQTKASIRIVLGTLGELV